MTTPLNPLNKQKIRRAFDRAAQRYNHAAALQQEVGNRLLERLDYIKLQPQRLLDAGAGTGYCTNILSKRYSDAQVIALDLAPAMLRQARRSQSRWHRWFGKQHFICGDAEQLPLRDNSVDLVFSNLTIQWCPDQDRVATEFQRILKPGGLLLFSTFGPDTLTEIRQSWAAVDDNLHVNTFTDMHDVGDALMRAGFSDPVVDVERLTLTYRDAKQPLRELKAMGANRVADGRRTSLTGKTRLQRYLAAYERFRRTDGTFPVTYEVIYALAWGAAAWTDHRPPDDGGVIIPLSALTSHRR